MAFIATSSTNKIAKLNKRYRLLAGGMRASKTISTELYLIARAQSDFTCGICKLKYGCRFHHSDDTDTRKTHEMTWINKPTLTSIVSESFPHLERGAIRDFENIMVAQGYWNKANWHGTKYTYTFETGSKIEFFSVDNDSKVHGPTRDRLFVNEANNVKQKTFEQLAFRTRDFIFADWNPVGDFYLYTEYQLDDNGPEPYSLDEDTDFLILTFEDNEALEPTIVKDIRKKAAMNPGWARVYAQGKRGQMEGKIFKNWQIIDDVPHEARLEVGGIDFGFARDKTAVCDIYRYNGGFIIDQVVSRVGYQDTDLTTMLLNRDNPNLLYVADSADYQKILTMQQMGLNVTGVIKKGAKGENFTNAAISFVQDQKISITKRSLDYIDSYRNFMWQTDKEGNIIPKYDHFKSDEMMSVIYGFTAFAPREETYEEYVDEAFTSMWQA